MLLDGGAGDRGGGLEGRVGEIADRGGDAGLEGGGIGRAGVRRGDLREAQVVGGAQGVALLAPAGARHRHLCRRIGADGLEQRGAHRLGGDGEIVVALAQQVEAVGMAGEHVAERDGEPEQADQSVPGRAGRPDAAEELLEERVLAGLARRFGQSQQAEDRVVPVGRRAEGLGGSGAEALQRGLGEEAADAVGAGEAEPGEHSGGGGGLGAALRGAHGVPVRPG